MRDSQSVDVNTEFTVHYTADLSRIDWLEFGGEYSCDLSSVVTLVNYLIREGVIGVRKESDRAFRHEVFLR